MPRTQKETKKLIKQLSSEAQLLYDEIKTKKMDSRTRTNYVYAIKNETHITKLQKLVRDLSDLNMVPKTVTKLTKKVVKTVKKQIAAEPKIRYSITNTIKFRFNNITWDGEDNFSEPRYHTYTVQTQPMKLSHITTEFIEASADVEVEIRIIRVSGDVVQVEKVNIVGITPVVNAPLAKRKNGNKKYAFKILEKADSINVNPGECVIDYIEHELKGKNGFKTLTRTKLIKYFHGVKVSVEQIIEFAQQYKTLSVYAINPLLEVFASHIATDKRYSLTFIVNNDHVYPVLNPDTKQSVAKTNKIVLEDYKFSLNYQNDKENKNKTQFIVDHRTEEIDPEAKIILFSNDNTPMMEIMGKVMNETGYVITNIKFTNGVPTAFQNPKTEQIYEVTDNYSARKKIVDGLSEDYGAHVIQFHNQSYTEISKIIYNNQFGNIASITSNLSNNVYDILDKHHIKPFIATVSLDYEKEETKGMGFDVVKSYSSVLLNNKVDYAILQPFDDQRPFTLNSQFVAGEYYISITINLCKGLMKYPKGWYPLNFVKYCIDKKVIKKSDITMYIPAKQFIKHDTFKLFVEFIFNTYSEAEAKTLVNYFVGDLGAKRTHKDVGCITSVWEIACSLFFQYSKDNHVTMDKMGDLREGVEKHDDLHFIRVRSEGKKYSTGLPIHRHIICGGIINLAELYYSLTISPTIRVISFNTDSIMIKVNPSEYGFDSFDHLNWVEESDSPIETLGKIRQEGWKIKSKQLFKLEDRPLEIFEPTKWEITKETETETFNDWISKCKSGLITGMGGCGKTEMIKVIRTSEDLVLSFTNTAVLNVKERCNGLENFYTFDSFFHEKLTFNEKMEKAGKFQRIIVDEYSMVPAKQMNMLNTIQQKFDTQLLFFGDANQLLQVEPSGVVYDYVHTDTFNKMCTSNQFICSYKEGFSRYDKTLKDVLDVFVQNDGPVALPKTKDVESKIRKDTYINICKSLAFKWYTNRKCCERYALEFPDRKSTEVTFVKKIRNNVENIKLRVAVGQQFMFGINDKKIDLYNGNICEITEIDDKTITLKYCNSSAFLGLSREKFALKFEPAFCQTIYRYQGATIRSDYTIHELPSMSKRELYTSLSRGTTLSNVHFDYIPTTFKNVDVSKPVELKVKIDNEIDEKYKNSKIYKITFDKYVYVGQTIRTLEERFKEHKSAFRGSDFIQTLKQFTKIAEIELLELYPCSSLKELLFREQYYIELYKISCEQDKKELLNKCHNSKKVKQTEIKLLKIDEIDEELNEYHIVTNTTKNCLRFQGKIQGKKVDISVTLKNTTPEAARLKLVAKIDVLQQTKIEVNFMD